MYAANPLDRGRLIFAPSLTAHDPNPPLSLQTPVTGSVTLASNEAGLSTLAGTLLLAIPLAVTDTGATSMTGAPRVTFPLAGTMAGSSTMTGDALITRGLGGTMVGLSVLTGDLGSLTITLTVLEAGTSTMTGALFVGLSGQMVGLGTETGAVSVNWALAALEEGHSVTGVPLVPASSLFPDTDLIPGDGGADLPITFGLGGTMAGTSAMTGGYTDLAGTMVSTSTMGYPQVPDVTLFPDASLYPGMLGGILTVERPVVLAGAMAGGSTLAGTLNAGVAEAEDVRIELSLLTEATIELSFLAEADLSLSALTEVSIGVS